MTHPYRNFRDEAFWKKAVSNRFDAAQVPGAGQLLSRVDRVASAGSCFAVNIVPYLEDAGYIYVRARETSAALGSLAVDNFSYSKFSAAYGNIYTARQARQLLERATGTFAPSEDRWHTPEGIVDPFRPGQRFLAASDAEFDLLRTQHFDAVLKVVAAATVFIFTLGLTEAWESSIDQAVFPACPGTIRGTYDPVRHRFRNFSVQETVTDLGLFIARSRSINPSLRFILTVSPVPLMATATASHVLSATVYSKSVLRVAAEELTQQMEAVTYFPAYELVCGPQAPHNYFEADRRSPGETAITEVMRAFLGRCEQSGRITPSTNPLTEQTPIQNVSRVFTEANCEEEAAGL